MVATSNRFRSVRSSLSLLVLLSLALLPLSALAGREASLPTASTIFTGTATLLDEVRFSTTGMLHQERDSQTATLMTDGRVLVVGGYTFGATDGPPELYDSTSGTWSTTGDLHETRIGHTATLLSDGKVLVVGGLEGNGSASAELYDPTSGTWSTTGSLNHRRLGHTATLLPDGRVLVVGGFVNGGNSILASAELYDPTSGTWSTTGDLHQARGDHTATLLTNGQVLVVGGSSAGNPIASVELYDPTSGTWSTTGDLHQARTGHTATLLINGQVLAVGGNSAGNPTASVELYDPTSGTWSTTGDLHEDRTGHTATLLTNGQVLVVGGYSPDDSILATVELYDPSLGTWHTTGSLSHERYDHTATLLSNGQVLVVGGRFHVGNTAGQLASSDLGLWYPANSFTGSLSLPGGWVATRSPVVAFEGTTTGAALEAGSLSPDGSTWGPWLATSPGLSQTTTVTVTSDGANLPVVLRLRDANARETVVVTGTVSVDTQAPTSSMMLLPATSAPSVGLAWSGSDALSGIAGYDLEVRQGEAGTWTPVLTATTATTATFTGLSGVNYAFRVRATDVAGNVEDWPETDDTHTLVDTEAPSGTLLLNGGALASTSPTVTLTFAAADAQDAVTAVRLSSDGTTWSDWQAYAGTLGYSLPGGDGTKAVWASFQDRAGNISAPVSATIQLDTDAGTQRLISINNGALWTNTVSVTLSIGAPAGTTQVEISNDGGFGGGVWQAFETRPAWEITSFGSFTLPRTVYVRVRNADGTLSDAYSDDIIYDPIPPTGSATISSVSANSVQVQLSAQDPDNLSGVAAMRVGIGADFEQATWEPYRTSTTLPLDGISSRDVRVYAQFRDGAGNMSTASCATPSGAVCPLETFRSTFFPMVRH